MGAFAPWGSGYSVSSEIGITHALAFIERGQMHPSNAISPQAAYAPQGANTPFDDSGFVVFRKTARRSRGVEGLAHTPRSLFGSPVKTFVPPQHGKGQTRYQCCQGELQDHAPVALHHKFA
jgi:hypothetical protein